MSDHYTNPEALGFHIYEGFRHHNYTPASCLNKIKKFKLRDGDIVVTTFPKSGTTWLLNAIKYIDEDDEESEVKLHHNVDGKGFLFMEIQIPGCPPVIDRLEKLEGPRLIKTHLQPNWFKEALELKTAKFIVLVRNEKDALVSLYHWGIKLPHIGFTGEWNDFFEDYMNDDPTRRSWVDWNLGWYSFKDQENVLYVKYEDMKEDLPRECERIARFLGKKIKNMDWLCERLQFNNMVKTNSFHLRKGETGGWKEYFSAEQNEVIDKRYAERVKSEGLIMRFEL